MQVVDHISCSGEPCMLSLCVVEGVQPKRAILLQHQLGQLGETKDNARRICKGVPYVHPSLGVLDAKDHSPIGGLIVLFGKENEEWDVD